MSSASDLRSGKTHRDENFPVASWIIHPRHRAPILAFYNFVRTADDIADHAELPADEKLRYLDRVYLPRDALAAAGASVEQLGGAKSSPQMLQCLQALAVKTAALLNEGRSLAPQVWDFRLGLEVAVIQAFADKIVAMLKVR